MIRNMTRRNLIIQLKEESASKVYRSDPFVDQNTMAPDYLISSPIHKQHTHLKKKKTIKLPRIK